MKWPTRTRKDRTLRERVHDTYLSKTKPRGDVSCPSCGVVFVKGRWSWGERPDGARELTCPACRRVNEHVPAGFVMIHGEFLGAHREEILNLVRGIAEAERLDHPLNRIMEVEDLADGVLITTTDLHLPRRLGEAIARAYSGQLSFHYDLDGDVVRVEWER